jgi:hypothetical protein
MKMRKLLCGMALVGIVIGTSGCSTGMIGGLYTDVTRPGEFAHMTTYQVTPGVDFESVAFVEGTAKGTLILGLVALGNFGYGAAIENALSKAPTANRLIDITVDTQIKSYLSIYIQYITKVRGRAIKMRNR